MKRFAFIIHPIDYRDVSRKFGIFKNASQDTVEKVTKLIPPLKVSEITGVRSDYGETEGWFIAVPLISNQLMNYPVEYVYKKIIKAGKIAERLGADIVGLGALTSVVGDAGITIANNLDIAVTSGNSYTVATAIEGAIKASYLMGKDIRDANVAVIGATGSIGKVCAEILAKQSKYINLVGRNNDKLKEVSEDLKIKAGNKINYTTDIRYGLEDADIVITVTSAIDAIIKPEYLKPGCVVCDVARPRDVSKEVQEVRDDVLVIEGGIVEVPGDVNFNFNFGFPPKTSYACMAETMILAMEEKIENYSLGRELTVKQVEDIALLAKKHGFKLSGFRSFERPVSNEQINLIKKNALNKRKKIEA